MTNSYASYPSSVEDETLMTQIKDVFRKESENQKPSRNVMQFLLSYAAAYQTANTGLMGQVAYMNN